MLACLAMVATPARAEDVTIGASLDNTLFQDATGAISNGAGPVLFAGNTAMSVKRRALIRFDVAEAVPAGSVITGATLTLNVSLAANTTPRTVALHRVLADWGEGASSTSSGNGAAATSGDATWIHTFWPDVFWSSAGGDFDPVASASQSVGDVGSYSWSGGAMVADVQTWLDTPSSNFGWLVLGDETVAATARRIDSREHATPANRPTLTIGYTAPAGVGGSDRALALGPCRPNPGRGFEASFSLAAPERVEVVVTDLSGRRLATPVDGVRGPGRHDVAWEGRGIDGRALPAGVYFVRLIAGGSERSARRFVLLR